MMKKKFLGILIYLIIIPPVSAEENLTDIIVTRAVICRDVHDREPVDIGISFKKDAGTLYLFTEIKAKKSGQIKHVWYYKNTKISERTLTYQPPRFRTWSGLYIKPGQTGDWNVEIVYETTVLNRLVFQIE